MCLREVQLRERARSVTKLLRRAVKPGTRDTRQVELTLRLRTRPGLDFSRSPPSRLMAFCVYSAFILRLFCVYSAFILRLFCVYSAFILRLFCVFFLRFLLEHCPHLRAQALWRRIGGTQNGVVRKRIASYCAESIWTCVITKDRPIHPRQHTTCSAATPRVLRLPLNQ